MSGVRSGLVAIALACASAAVPGQGGNADPLAIGRQMIYDAWAYFPCSNMPRMGHNGFLTPEQIAHVVAYLVDPASPVNRR